MGNDFRRKIFSLAAAAVISVTGSAGALGGSVTVLTAGSSVTAFAAESSVRFIQTKGCEEAVYATWASVTGASDYNVYIDGAKIDNMLVRQYSGYMRADAVGLKAGSHTIKVVPVKSGQEDSSAAAETKLTVTSHDRSGFGWVKGTSSGAYNEDGTLRNGAVVLYVTEKTKDTVTHEVVTDSKGGTTKATGIQDILTACQKGYDTRPLCIRFIGEITDPAVLMDGDLLLKGSGASKRLSCGVTIEGIGNDTVFNGFGLRIANSSNVEVRNIGFMNCNSGEGDDVGLQQNNDHVWVHNCDFFYGDAGSDADQVKGDGALDTKTSSYITHSYNHFWDNGKSNLQGMKSESAENYITYHHNWYDHSDSRHPRIRTCTVHSYNNYFDGNAKYGVGATMGCSVFVENNYFRNCPKPMMSSMQGTDALGEGTFSGETGGIIKSFGNYMEGVKSYITYQDNNTSFDAFEASSRNETVPSGVKTLSGGTTYNNFDTDSSLMYTYTPDAAADVPAVVMAKAGRVDGGDFKWSFNNSVDDESYAVNQALKNALVAYKGTVIAIGGGFTEDNTPPPTTTVTEPPVVTTTTSGNEPVVTTTTISSAPDVQTTTIADPPLTPVTGGRVHDFTASGTSSDFYTITGNLSNSKGTVTFNGLTLTQCLKMESATSIGFTSGTEGTITLVFAEPTATVKIDGVKYTSTGDGIITASVGAGEHSITKADSVNLFYMIYSDKETSQPAGISGDADCDGEVKMNDAVLIMQAISNPDVYGIDGTSDRHLTAEGRANADCSGSGDGLSPSDALAIQRYLLKLTPSLPEA